MTIFAGVQEFIFTAVSKSAIGLMIFSGAVLFLPINILSMIFVDGIKDQYKSQFGALFLLSLATVLSDLIKVFYKYIVSQIEERRKKIAYTKKGQEYLATIKSRLNSLSLSEKKWIQYCLYNNQQTLIARATDSTGNSLANKMLIASSEGNVMAMPFTFVDSVWQYLLANKSDFLPHIDDKNRAQFEAEMKGFRNSQGAL